MIDLSAAASTSTSGRVMDNNTEANLNSFIFKVYNRDTNESSYIWKVCNDVYFNECV